MGVEELELSSFTISPNPNKGFFNLQMEQPLKEITQLVMIDNTGRKVMEQILESDITEINSATVVKPGMYLLQLQQNGIVGKIQRVVIE